SYPRLCDVFVTSTSTLERRRMRDFVARGGLLWAGVLAWWILGSTAVWAQQESAPREDSPSATSPETEPAAEPASDTRAGEVAKVYRQWGGKIEQVGPDTYILL